MARISKSQLIKLQRKFKTDAAIGEQFGITRQAVHQLRKKYAVESSLIDNPKRNQQIIEAYDKGASGTSLAKKFKLSISQTYRIINETKPVKKKAAAKKAKKAKAAPKKAVKKATVKVKKTKATPKKAVKKVSVKVKKGKSTPKKVVKKAPAVSKKTVSKKKKNKSRRK